MKHTVALLAMLLFAASTAGCSLGRAPLRQPAPTGSTGLPTLTDVLNNTARLSGAGYLSRPSQNWSGVTIYARPGVPQLQLLLNTQDQVVGVRGVFPRSVGLQPWFDQAVTATLATTTGTSTGATGGPSTGSASGSVTSNPASSAISSSSTAAQFQLSSGGSPSSATGSSTSVSVSRSRTTSPRTEASGKTTASSSTSASSAGPANLVIGGKPANDYTQTIWFIPPTQAANPVVTPGLTSLQALTAINPGLSRARRLTPFIPGMGYLWGSNGFGVLVMVGRNGAVTGFQGTFPIDLGWQSMYDQLPNHIDSEPMLHLSGYTQRIYLVPPTTIR